MSNKIAFDSRLAITQVCSGEYFWPSVSNHFWSSQFFSYFSLQVCVNTNVIADQQKMDLTKEHTQIPLLSMYRPRLFLSCSRSFHILIDLQVRAVCSEKVYSVPRGFMCEQKFVPLLCTKSRQIPGVYVPTDHQRCQTFFHLRSKVGQPPLLTVFTKTTWESYIEATLQSCLECLLAKRLRYAVVKTVCLKMSKTCWLNEIQRVQMGNGKKKSVLRNVRQPKTNNPRTLFFVSCAPRSTATLSRIKHLLKLNEWK